MHQYIYIYIYIYNQLLQGRETNHSYPKVNYLSIAVGRKMKKKKKKTSNEKRQRKEKQILHCIAHVNSYFFNKFYYNFCLILCL